MAVVCMLMCWIGVVGGGRSEGMGKNDGVSQIEGRFLPNQRQGRPRWVDGKPGGA